jgi:tRNA uridine 5-carboxymethylaminomethyl modification enzyme
LAKGHLVREIDALGGEMGKATDLTGLQFRMLNTKKGPSVWAPRVQCDKKAYQFRLKWVCEQEPNLTIIQGQALRLCREGDRVTGVETQLEVRYEATTVVVTTGTFLRGLMHIGTNQQSGGRSGEAAATGLSASLQEFGIQLGRLKTGTPPRILRKSIAFERTAVQHGDEPPPFMSHWREELFHVEQSVENSQKPPAGTGTYPPGSVLERIGGQLPCYITYTTSATAATIRENLHLSPMYSGTIEGTGPRYCPSIEDKIVKFPDKERHQIFLEPEGIATEEFYINGFSTCLPYEVQVKLIQTVVGCEQARILRPAYAVEYDFAFPTQLHPSLESKRCQNLFLAGQINGTSGYEEAAAQGLIAGMNAALTVQQRPPITLGREQAYIGVLIDDLVTKGTVEPYRMFTSRAEHRLLLRQDNCDTRLSRIGFDAGLLPRRNFDRYLQKEAAVAAELERIRTTRSGQFSLAQILRRPEMTYADLPSKNDALPEEVTQQVEILVKYEGYIDRQEAEVARFRTLDQKQIPNWLDYSTVPSLRREARQKLTEIRPKTIGQASRISGVSPADLSMVLVWMKRGDSSRVSPVACDDDELSSSTGCGAA